MITFNQTVDTLETCRPVRQEMAIYREQGRMKALNVVGVDDLIK